MAQGEDSPGVMHPVAGIPIPDPRSLNPSPPLNKPPPPCYYGEQYLLDTVNAIRTYGSRIAMNKMSNVYRSH